MNYLRKLFVTGALRGTPYKVVSSLLNSVSSGPYKTIVEIGAGQGELTRELLNLHQSLEKYYCFEIDKESCARLLKSFSEVEVFERSAFDFETCLKSGEKIDCFVSSIPLSFYGKKETKKLFKLALKRMNNDGKIVIVFTAFWLIPLLKRLLPNSTITPFFTFPPYFLLNYTHKRSDRD